MLKKQISIIGCGWLGFSLAKTLIENDYSIKGSTTSKDKLELLKANNIQSFSIHLNESTITGNYSNFLSKSETIIINLPPGLRKNPNKNHVAEISHLITAIEESSVRNVLYISSTSVYKEDYNFPVITENQLPNASTNTAKQLIIIERILQDNSNFNTTVLRFGGLFDANRHPAKHLSKKVNIANPNAPINLIHKNDCIEIIRLLLKKNIWNTTFNAVFPKHPNKKRYYTNYCKQYNLPLPKFSNSLKSKGKIVDSKQLIAFLNYAFKHTP